MTDSIRHLSELIPLTGADSSVKAMIFDFGGTLDTGGDHWSRVILDGYWSENLYPDPDNFRQAYIAAERALSLPGAVAPTDTMKDLLIRKLALQRQHLGYRRSLDAVALYCYRTALSCISEASATLHLLSSRLPLALVSNFYGNLDAVVSDLGIRDCFTLLVDSSSVGIRKPDPAIFRLAFDRLRDIVAPEGSLHPSEVVVVGDSLKNDIFPARSIGLRAIRLEGRPWLAL